MHFETFDKSRVAFSGEPHITIQKRGTITINAASFAALDEPNAVELLYDRADHILGLRTIAADVDHAAFVRRSTRSPSGPWVISAMAFIRHFEIDTEVARRWVAQLRNGVLCAQLTTPCLVVSRTHDIPPRPRPRPRPV